MVKVKPEWVKTNIAIIRAILKLGKPAFGDLLKETGLSKPSLTEHLKELLNKKLIIAERSQEDKRKWLYSLNPNELAIITVNEVIEAIKEELKAIGEELKPEEEQKLREFLIKHFRKLIIEEYLGKEAYKEFGDPLYYVLRRFSLAVMNRLSYDKLRKATKQRKVAIKLDKAFEDFINKYYSELENVIKAHFEELLEDTLNKEDIKILKEITIASKDYISSELAKKWIKTEFFKEYTPFGQAIELTPVIIAILKTMLKSS